MRTYAADFRAALLLVCWALGCWPTAWLDGRMNGWINGWMMDGWGLAGWLRWYMVVYIWCGCGADGDDNESRALTS
jgi:hypothetical protein